MTTGPADIDAPAAAHLGWRAVVAVGGTAILAILSLSVHVAPRSMGMFPLIIGATEFSPFLVLLDLLWCLPANRLLRAHKGLRAATIATLIAGAGLAVIPLTEFTRAAADASAQLGTEEAQPQYSLLTSLRGLPAAVGVRERAVPYRAADGSPLVMRLFSMASATAQPVVVVLYGGAWRGGDASQCADVSRALASRGFVVAAIDYRHAPASRFPAQLLDIRASLALLRDSSASWHIDPARIALLGRSSGGHLAELAAFSPGDVPLKAVVALYAPYDLAEGYRDLPSPDPIGVQAVLSNFIGGTPSTMAAAYHDASPASFVRAGLPPTLYVIAGKDHVVKPEFNRRAASDLRRVHVPVVVAEVPWAEHGFDMARGGLGSQLAFAVVRSFLDRELHP